MLNISVLVSGNGSNLQALMDAIEEGKIRGAEIGLVVSDNPKAYALERAREAHIPTMVIDVWGTADDEAQADDLLLRLQRAGTDLIVLAGYLKILPPNLVNKYKKRIINIHPSLIPKYCGKGFYGAKVHEAVLAAGETETGATVHYVDEGVDTGEIIMQETVRVLEGDTVETLSTRVLDMEHAILVKATTNIVKKMRSRSTLAALLGLLAGILLAGGGLWASVFFGLIKLF